jgi:hypothetical protein
MRPTYHTLTPARRTLRMHVAAGFLLLGLLSCSDPLAPVKPEWDVNAYVPVVNRTFTMEELLSDDGEVRVTAGSDNTLILSQSFPIEQVALGERLTVADQSFRFSQPCGAIRFDMPSCLDQQLDANTLFPAVHGGAQVVPPLSNELGVAIDVDVRQYFEEALFGAGLLSLTFRNDLPVPVSVDAIRLIDDAGAQLGQIAPHRVVDAGQTVALDAFRLDGMRLRNRMRLGFIVSTPGSGGTTVTFSSGAGLAVTGSIRETNILEIRGFVPSQTLQYSRLTDIGADGLRVQEGLVRAGALALRMANAFGLGATVTVTVPEAQVNGAPLARTLHIGARSSADVSLDFSGATLRPVSGRQINVVVDIVTDDAKSAPVTMRTSDSLGASADLQGVRLASLTGACAPRSFSINDMRPSDFALARKLRGDAVLSEARMWATVRNGSGLPVSLSDAVILGRRCAPGGSASLSVAATTLGANVETTIPFEQSRVLAFLNSFMPAYPDSVGLQATMVLNPAGASGTAHDADGLTGDVFLEVPMKFSRLDGEASDTVRLLIDDATRSKLGTVNEGTLTFDVENHLPTGVTIEPDILDASYQQILAPRNVTGAPVTVGSAHVDAQGFATTSTTQKVEVRFAAADFRTLARGQWIRFRIAFNAGSRPASFRTTDYVRVRGYARLSVSSKITD